MRLYTHSHSRELLDNVACGRPLALYQMIEKDLKKATETWKLTDWNTCLVAVDNNQIKKSSYNAKHKDKTVSCYTLNLLNLNLNDVYSGRFPKP